MQDVHGMPILSILRVVVECRCRLRLWEGYGNGPPTGKGRMDRIVVVNQSCRSCPSLFSVVAVSRPAGAHGSYGHAPGVTQEAGKPLPHLHADV